MGVKGFLWASTTFATETTEANMLTATVVAVLVLLPSPSPFRPSPFPCIGSDWWLVAGGWWLVAGGWVREKNVVSIEGLAREPLFITVENTSFTISVN